MTWYGYDPSGSNYEVYYATNAGGSWSSPEDLTTQYDYSQYSPVIALDSNGNPRVTWYGYDENESYNQVSYVADSGSGWGTPRSSSSTGTFEGTTWNYAPQLAIDSSGNTHAVWYGWYGNTGYQILYATNAGGSWSTPVDISTRRTYDPYEPR